MSGPLDVLTPEERGTYLDSDASAGEIRIIAFRLCEALAREKAEVERLKTMVQHWESKARDCIAALRPGQDEAAT